MSHVSIFTLSMIVNSFVKVEIFVKLFASRLMLEVFISKAFPLKVEDITLKLSTYCPLAK